MNIVAERLREAMADARVSQSKLARDVGATQGSISLILLGKTTNSRLLPKIATRLRVSLAWLLGMADDPLDSVPPLTEDRVPTQVMLPVTLPSENALADMFEGLLMAIDLDRKKPLDEVARELAELLPTGLARMQGDLLELPRPPRRRPASPAPSAAAEVPANVEPAHQQ